MSQAHRKSQNARTHNTTGGTREQVRPRADKGKSETVGAETVETVAMKHVLRNLFSDLQRGGPDNPAWATFRETSRQFRYFRNGGKKGSSKVFARGVKEGLSAFMLVHDPDSVRSAMELSRHTMRRTDAEAIRGDFVKAITQLLLDEDDDEGAFKEANEIRSKEDGSRKGRIRHGAS